MSIELHPKTQVTPQYLSELRQTCLPFIGTTPNIGGSMPTQESQFIETALLDGAHTKIPQNMSERQWNRNLTILFDYITTDQTVRELGKTYNISAERVNNVVQETMRRLWDNSSLETQEQFPEDQLENPTRRVKELNALAFVYDYLELRPNHSPQKICTLLGISPGIYNQRRLFLREHGFLIDTLGGTSKLDLQQLDDQLRYENDPEKTRELFRQVDYSYIKRNTRLEEPAIIPISNIMPELVYKPNTTVEIKTLLEANDPPIPVGEVVRIVQSGKQAGNVQRYYFIAPPYLEDARKVIQEMNIPRSVSRIDNPEITENLPSSSALSKREGYSAVHKALQDQLPGYEVPQYIRSLLVSHREQIPVPVYSYGNSIYIKDSDIPEFVKFMKTIL